MFRHGDKVQLEDKVYGSITTGTLHLPDRYMSGPKVQGFWKPQSTEAGYGLHTVVKDDGTRFRSEGYLSAV